MAPLPQVDFPTIQVTANLPGASPETMASSVAQPLEYQFGQIPGVSQLTSTSVLNNTTIIVQFDLDRNIDAAAGDIQAAIDAAAGQLPKNLPTPPSYKKVNPADSPILVMSVQSDVLPTTEVDDAAETIIAQQISRVPGVGIVTIGGQQKPAVRGAGRSREARRPGDSTRGRGDRDQRGHCRCSEGVRQRPRAQLRHLRQ